MKYNYNNIIRSISVNLGVKSPNSVDVSIIKADIYSTLMKCFAKVKPIKENINKNITSNTNEFYLPENFFIADEVVFKDSNNIPYLSKEVTEEEYLRWQPNTNYTESNFEVEMLSEQPQRISYTKENGELDGYIGYCFADKDDLTILKFKPAVTGNVDVFYSVVPEDSIPDKDDTPNIHSAFRSLLILGPTIAGLLRQNPTTEIDLSNKTLKIRMYQDEFKQTLSDYAGYVNRTVNTPIVQPFDFLNFYDDIIYG